jgi:hypothetical protein
MIRLTWNIERRDGPQSRFVRMCNDLFERIVVVIPVISSSRDYTTYEMRWEGRERSEGEFVELL